MPRSTDCECTSNRGERLCVPTDSLGLGVLEGQSTARGVVDSRFLTADDPRAGGDHAAPGDAQAGSTLTRDADASAAPPSRVADPPLELGPCPSQAPGDTAPQAPGAPVHPQHRNQKPRAHLASRVTDFYPRPCRGPKRANLTCVFGISSRGGRLGGSLPHARTTFHSFGFLPWSFGERRGGGKAGRVSSDGHTAGHAGGPLPLQSHAPVLPAPGDCECGARGAHVAVRLLVVCTGPPFTPRLVTNAQVPGAASHRGQERPPV